jgi:hypothetical protein
MFVLFIIIQSTQFWYKHTVRCMHYMFQPIVRTDADWIILNIVLQYDATV